MSNSSHILPAAQKFVQQFLLEQLPFGRLYHTGDHAEEVAKVCKKLAKDAKLDNKATERLQLAAWFANCGYAHTPSEVGGGSAQIAKDFLSQHNYSQAGVEQVLQLIESIHEEDEPVDTREKIFWDATYSYLSRKRFERRSRLLRLELEEMEEKTLTAYEWHKNLLETLLNQEFYTLWARERYAKQRNKNISIQRKNVRNAQKQTLRKKTGKELGRGVDTLYRITLRNHLELSNIADGKANMIISINTLVLSILITAGTAGFSFNSETLLANITYILPILLLMLSSLIAIIYAVLSAMPNVSGKSFDEDDIAQHKVSLLFFGNFLKLHKQRFVEHLRELKKDQNLLYDDLSRDLYNLGNVLDKKYRLLTISYRVFVGGLVVSFLLFLGFLAF